tara:strand:- start:16167 stop:16394 length:228 start_codon:yes stop_codon:yes gene_type:complete
MKRAEDWCQLIGAMCAVFGFTYQEVVGMTLGQVMRYGKVLPDILPLRNPMAAGDDTDKKLTGDAAIAAVRMWQGK